MKVNESIIAKEIQGETVLLNKENGDYFSLNKVGTDIFNYVSKILDSGEIIDLLPEAINTA